MIECDWFTYAGPPKSGNQWFIAAMQKIGLPFKHPGMHGPGQVVGKPRVTIVREPATWLRSFFLNLHGSIGMPFVDIFQSLRRDAMESFEDFGWRYVKEMPSQISTMHMHYESEIEIRTEHLRQDTAAVLSALGVPCDLDIIMELPRIGVTVRETTMSDELRAAINATDYWMADRPAMIPEVSLAC